MPEPKNRVLIITYYWPPAGGPGVQRFLKFSKHLRSFDWEPIIITPENGAYPYEDPSLMADVGEDLKIIKTKTLEPFEIYNKLQGKKGKSVPVAMGGIKDSKSIFQKLAKYIRANFFLPDARVGWNRYAYKAAAKVIMQNKIDAIITTGPPHSTHLVGRALKRKFNIPWLADFRDPWTKIYYNKFLPRSKKTQAKDLALETSVLGSADIITTVSQGMAKDLKDRARDIAVILNGFENEDIPDTSPKKTDQFTIGYIGNFKPNQNLPSLWEAFKELSSESSEFANKAKLKFTGSIDAFILKDLKKVGLEKQLILQDFVPHHEATRIMSETCLLLLPIPEAKNNQYILTGKIFEYLANKNAILSIGPTDGNAAQILSECKRDKMCHYQDKAQIKAQIKHYFELWMKDQMVYKHRNDAHMIYSRKALTEQLAAELNKIKHD